MFAGGLWLKRLIPVSLCCAGAAALVLGVLCRPVVAQGPFNTHFATVVSKLTPSSASRPGQTMLRILIQIAPGYHIQANKPAAGLIATTLSLARQRGIAFGAIRFPAVKRIPSGVPGEGPLPVYVGTAAISVPVEVSKAAAPGRYHIAGTLQFQGCNATACFPPKSQAVGATLTVR